MATAFSPLPDLERLALAVPPLGLAGRFICPRAPQAVVVLAHSGLRTPIDSRFEALAERWAGSGIATLVFDPFTAAEFGDRANRYDVPRMAERVVMAARFVRDIPIVADLPLMLFGSGTAAAACLQAAVALGGRVAAIASCAGRPDLARDALPQVKAPTLCFASTTDEAVLDFNRAAVARLDGEKELRQMRGPPALIDDAAVLAQIANESAAWFLRAAGTAARASLSLVPDTGFADRAEAGRLLALRLLGFGAKPVRVFAPPSDALFVAAEIARTLKAPLDILAVRTIPAPADAAVTIGAIAEGTPPEIALDAAAIRGLNLAQADIAAAVRSERDGIVRLQSVFREGRPLPTLGAEIALLVDDGETPAVAIEACLAALARAGAATRVLAMPRLPASLAQRLADQPVATVSLGEGGEAEGSSLYRSGGRSGEDERLALIERYRTRPTHA